MWTSKPGWGVRANGIVTGVVTVFVVLIGVAGATATPPSKTTPTVAGSTPSATATPASTQPLVTSIAAPTLPATAPPTVPPTALPTAPHTAVPTAPPTQRPANLCGAPSNPWGYNFCGGSLIYSPPSNFCDYFNCIPSFWESTKGYVDE